MISFKRGDKINLEVFLNDIASNRFIRIMNTVINTEHIRYIDMDKETIDIHLGDVVFKITVIEDQIKGMVRRYE